MSCSCSRRGLRNSIFVRRLAVRRYVAFVSENVNCGCVAVGAFGVVSIARVSDRDRFRSCRRVFSTTYADSKFLLTPEEEGAGGTVRPFPRFLLRRAWENRFVIEWEVGESRAIPISAFGERYRRYRLPDSGAEAALARTMSRYGQMAPVVVCLREETPEILDGFKRLAAARTIPHWTTLSARLMVADERVAKAAIYGLNQAGRHTQELEEAWIVFALVREDGLKQLEAAELLGRHKSWVCRRLALLERLDESARDELRLGLLGPTAARSLVPLPAGNQIEVLSCARREGLTTTELRGVAGLVSAATTRQQVEYVLEKPRQALAQSQAGPFNASDPRLSPMGNRVSRQLAALLDQLARMETWLSQRGRAELHAGDRLLLAERFVRLGVEAGRVADLARDLGQELSGS